MTTFKIATWNVNSLRVRLPQVLSWIQSTQPDVLALQEIKMMDSDFPFAEIESIGYNGIASGQKTYNGMAILSRKKAEQIVTDIPELHDHQRRVLAVSIDDVRILNLYIPNGESVSSEKYQYKLNWLKHLDIYLQHELKTHQKMLVLGDFNIAPENIDVHDPKFWEGKVLFSDLERKAFRDMLSLGLQDCFRKHHSGEKNYTWWDYRLNAFKRNLGLRIDHILASNALARNCTTCYIDKIPRTSERPSDHTPVVAEFTI